MMFLWRRLSRTSTEPTATLVSVPSQRSCTSQRVPRTVAELYLPSVRNVPLPSPQSLRVFFFLAAADAVLLAAFGHFASGSASLSTGIGLVAFFWLIVKMPS